MEQALMENGNICLLYPTAVQNITVQFKSYILINYKWETVLSLLDKGFRNKFEC